MEEVVAGVVGRWSDRWWCGVGCSSNQEEEADTKEENEERTPWLCRRDGAKKRPKIPNLGSSA